MLRTAVQKERDRKPAVADPFLNILSADDRALHDRIIDIRDKHHAHTDFYERKVRIQPGDASVWVRTGVDPSRVTADDVRLTIRHATTLETRAPTREEIKGVRRLAMRFAFAFQSAADRRDRDRGDLVTPQGLVPQATS